MAAPRKYPDELRERATRLAIEARKDPAGRAGAIKRIADQLDVHPEALRGWVKRAEIDDGVLPGTTSAEAARIAELEREVKELRRANAISRWSGHEGVNPDHRPSPTLPFGSGFRMLPLLRSGP